MHCASLQAAGKQVTHANATLTPAPSSSLYVCICVAITVRYVQKLASSCLPFLCNWMFALCSAWLTLATATVPWIIFPVHYHIYLHFHTPCFGYIWTKTVLKKEILTQLPKWWKKSTYICSSLEYHSYTSWHPEAPMTCLLLAQYIHIIKRKLQGHSSQIMRVTWYYDENKKMSSARYRGATPNKVCYCYSLHHCVNLSFHPMYIYVIT